MRTAGNIAGIAVLARIASIIDPEESTTGWPLRRAVATTCIGIVVSTSSRWPRCGSKSARRREGSTSDPGWRKAAKSRRNVTGKTSRRLMPSHSASSRNTPSRVGLPAKYAPLIAPTDEPMTMSGRMPAATIARSMPTCTAPRLPPPANTKAVLDVATSGLGFAMIAWAVIDRSSIDHRENLLSRQRIVAQATQHAARDQVGVRLVDATRGHAMMRRLDDDADALRLENIVDGVGDLGRHLLLD